MNSLRHLLILMLLFLAVALGCSSSTEPDDDDGGGGGTVVTDFPEIPAPTCANCNIPDVSDTLTVIKPLTGDSATTFAPIVNKALADWAYRLTNICYVDECSEKCIVQDSLSPYLNRWSNDTTLNFDVPGWREDPEKDDDFFGCFPPIGEHNLVSPIATSISLNDFPKNITFLNEGNAKSNIIDTFLTIVDLHGDGNLVLSRSFEFNVVMIAYGLTNPLYLRRDRYWVRLPIDGQSGGSIELTNGQTKSLTSTFSQGSSITEAEEFSSTFDISGPGYLSGISASLSQTFSTSTTVSSWNSTSVTYTVTGVANQTVIATVWAVVEEYTFCDVDGTPYTDPNWDLNLPKLVIENTKERLETWDF